MVLNYIKEKGLAEFVRLGLQEKYKDKIDAWFVYLDQKEFGYNLNKLILKEVNRYMASKKTINEIMAEVFKEPEWVIEIEEGLIEKYPELRTMRNMILGYA